MVIDSQVFSRMRMCRLFGIMSADADSNPALNLASKI